MRIFFDIILLYSYIKVNRNWVYTVKKWITILCCVFLLSACSVTIDPASENPGDQQNEQNETSTNHSNSSSAVSVNDVESETDNNELLDIIGKFIPFARQAEPAQTLHYLALGDSLTKGIGDENDKYGFTGLLSTELENWSAISTVELDNRGKNGRRSDQLLGLLEKGHYDKELANADLITITLGGNDVMKVVKSDMFNLKPEMFQEALVPFEERYEKIIAEIRSENESVPIVLVGFYNPFSIITGESAAFQDILTAWNSVIEQTALNDVNACFVPVDDLFETNDDLIYHTDFFHPNANGYEKMTGRIIEQMKACNIEKMSNGLIGFEE